MSDLVGTSAQVAERLELSEDVVQALVRENRIPHIKIGPRKTLFPWAAIEEWLLDEARSSTRTNRPVLGLVSEQGPPGQQ